MTRDLTCVRHLYTHDHSGAGNFSTAPSSVRRRAINESNYRASSGQLQQLTDRRRAFLTGRRWLTALFMSRENRPINPTTNATATLETAACGFGNLSPQLICNFVNRYADSSHCFTVIDADTIGRHRSTATQQKDSLILLTSLLSTSVNNQVICSSTRTINKNHTSSAAMKAWQ